MTIAHRLCGLSIVLTLLLVQPARLIEVSTEYPDEQYGADKDYTGNDYTQGNYADNKYSNNYYANDDKYEVIDVAGHSADGAKQPQTGQTTRIYTAGEVDDDFWLKHLGDDFKHAIHLQVGSNDPYSDIYNYNNHNNMQQNQQNYAIQANPVAMNATATKTYAMKYAATQKTQPNANFDGKANSTAGYMKQQKRENEDTLKMTTQEPELSAAANALNETNNEANASASAYDRQPYERSSTNDERASKNPQTLYQPPQAYEMPKTEANLQSTKHKYTSAIKTTTAAATQHKTYNKDALKHKTKTKGERYKSRTSAYSTVVVNLPEMESTVHQLDNTQMPIVVRMPPVIYHRNPAYAQFKDNRKEDDHSNTQTYTAQQFNGEGQTQHTNSHYTNYQQQQPQPQQHLQQQQKQHTEQNPRTQQQQQFSTYPQKYYLPPPFENPPYNMHDNTEAGEGPGDPDDNGDAGAQPQTPSKAALKSQHDSNESIPKLRYIVRKSSSSSSLPSYNRRSKQQQLDSSAGAYNRISRSTKNLFYRGL